MELFVCKWRHQTGVSEARRLQFVRDNYNLFETGFFCLLLIIDNLDEERYSKMQFWS